MKKFFSLVLAAALVSLAGSQAALAGVKASRHDMADAGNTYTSLIAFNKYGTCSACHVPHGAGGERLFPSTQPAAVGGFFAPLCGSCHDSSVTSGNINMNYSLTVLNSAHGYLQASLPLDETMDTSGLPYVVTDARGLTVNIECLSCHDVHNQNSFRPFLQVNLDNLCELCHSNRVNNSTATVGYANRGTAATTHPAGPVFTGSVSGGGSVIDLNGGSLADLVVSNAGMTGGSTWTGKSPWDSGMHLTNQGAVSAAGAGVDCITCHTVHWDEDRAAIGNVKDYLGFIDSGAASGGDTAAANLFCEYCHRGSNQPSGGGTPGTYWWNPGTTFYSHPNDDIGASSTAVNVALAWRPSTSSPRTGSGASQLTCTGCHGVHPEGAGAEVMPNTPIILNYGTTGSTNPCQACHSALGINHHPIGGSYTTSGNTAGNLTCNGGNVNVGVPTCHGSAGGTANNTGAHNRISPMAPVTNGSTMCVACHTVNPSVYTTTTPYTASGSASHFIGDAGSMFPGGTGAGPRTTSDAGMIAVAWTSGIASQLVNTDNLICESCHSLKAGNMRGGDGDTQMLLEYSGSARNVSTGYAALKNLCTGCHGIPSGTHPLQGANQLHWPITATAASAGLTFTGAGLNCESCHSPHDANTGSGNYILDTTTSFGTGSAMEVEPKIEYADFCGQCHGGFK